MTVRTGMRGMVRPNARPAPARKRRARAAGVTDLLSAGWLALLIASMLLLPTLLDLDPLRLDATARLAGPSADHLLGTDNLGRDLLARALDGARVSLLIGLGSTLISIVIGVPLGMLAAYARGPVDAVVSFVVDVILAFPGLVLALALTAFLGGSTGNVMIAITLPMIPVFVRLARAQTLSVLGREFVEASQVIGTPAAGILRRDVLPSIAEAILAFALVNVGRAIIIEGGLSFLGIGVPLPQPTWGTMISEGRLHVATDPLMILVPSAFLMFTILSLNLLSDRFLVDDGTTGGGAA
ncbi:ABC transporter permease [Actinomadura sp. 1N219]|uniref:ABC transporter permease n=1 Tax=Actinomadura sp. 1N219 TaxID=3375152 RepID=UPI003796F19A